jgi:hypothetical protein
LRPSPATARPKARSHGRGPVARPASTPSGRLGTEFVADRAGHVGEGLDVRLAPDPAEDHPAPEADDVPPVGAGQRTEAEGEAGAGGEAGSGGEAGGGRVGFDAVP